MSEFDFIRDHLPLSDEEITATLALMKAEDPDSYALLTEHIPIPEHLLPE